jgi:hypothetical protein
MSSRRRLSISVSRFIALFVLTTPAWGGIGFQPVSPDELKMTAEPKAPGAPAIILFREVDRDDRGQTAHEDVYYRIKILTEEGRKYADIEIPFFKQEGTIVNLHARTIKPDGTIVDFSGKAFDKMIVKARGVKYMAKTFTLPDVQTGCVLEYYYTTDLSENVLYNSRWILSDELFTRSAKFSLKPYVSDYVTMHVRWTWNRLPAGTAQPAEAANGVINLESSNIPAFQIEDYMPPQDEMKSRVDFIYSDEAMEKDPDTYWKKLGKKRNEALESFIGKHKSMEQAVAEIVSPGDTPEVKLRKIYARVQQIRNTSYEQEKSDQEQKRNKDKAPENVESIWKKQYANGMELTWLFLALARAAGFDASGVWVSDRQNYFFSPNTMDGHRLDANVVVVKLDGKDRFFDPGAAFTPFGMLPWIETGVQGLKLSKDGGTWLQTTLPDSNESGIERKADLKLTDTGDLEGKVTVTYTGLEALQRRLDEHLADDTERKKYLEDEIREAIPVACDVELTNQPDWKSSDPKLVAEYSLKVSGWVSGAGKHALLPVGLFSAPEKRLFDHADRVHPIYFSYPFGRADNVNIDLPLGWQISTVPQPQKLDAKAVVYVLDAKNDKGTLHIDRSLNVDITLLSQENYGKLRKIFQVVRTADEQQVMLQPGASTARN